MSVERPLQFANGRAVDGSLRDMKFWSECRTHLYLKSLSELDPPVLGRPGVPEQ